MLESGAEAEADIAAIEQRLKDSETEEGRVAVASGGLREKLQRFESDLTGIVGSNLELRPRVDSLRADRKTVREGKVVSVRLDLGGSLTIKKNKTITY